MRPKSFTIEYGGIAPQIITDCGVCEAYVPTPNTAHPRVATFKALWDTGATISTISPNVVSALGLTPVGFAKTYHAQGASNAKVYRVNLLLPNETGHPAMTVLEGNLHGFDMLIGMDIISKGDFAVTHSDGKTTFTFRIPSIEKLDFVDNSPKAMLPIAAPKKVGRNEPCPCGSGKKYKYCCGK